MARDAHACAIEQGGAEVDEVEARDVVQPLAEEVEIAAGAAAELDDARLRRQLRDSMIAALVDADVLVLPTLPLSIPEQGTSVIELGGKKIPLPGAMTRLTGPFNSSGMPALSIPCGTDSSGLPVSLQLVGRPGADATVLAVGKWAESVLAG